MDVKLIRRYGGFDFVGGKAGIITVESFETMVPIALFGGNIEQSTPQRRIQGQQNLDWWGNATLLQTAPKEQFNSLTQRTLQDVALNSAGRERIQRAVEADLQFMADFANVTVVVSLISVDSVKITIEITEPDTLNQSELVYIWDAFKKELNEDNSLIPPPPGVNGFNYNLNFPFENI